MLLALPEPHLPLSLPVFIVLHYLSIADARSVGRRESCLMVPDGHSHWVEYGKQVSVSLSCPAPNTSLSLPTPKCRKDCIISRQEVYQSPSLSLDDRNPQTKLETQGRLVAILFQTALPAFSKFWLGDLLHQSWYLYM